MLFKKALYEELGVEEYVLFDPLAEYLEPPLQGYRLVAGQYEPLPEHEGQEGERGLRSNVLDTVLQAKEKELALYDRETGERLLPPQRAYERLREETQARRAAEAEVTRLRAELARLQDEQRS